MINGYVTKKVKSFTPTSIHNPGLGTVKLRASTVTVACLGTFCYFQKKPPLLTVRILRYKIIN